MTELFHISKHDKTRLVGPDWYADVTSLCYTSYAPCMSQEDLQEVTRLLAAAPMLYEALEGLLGSLSLADVYSSEESIVAYNAAKAALAAAK